MRGQHIPNRIADYNAVFDFGTESIGRRKKQVGIKLAILELVTRHYWNHARINAERVQIQLCRRRSGRW
jgi:hypothetical protein